MGSDTILLKTVRFTRDFNTLWIRTFICECPVRLQMINIFADLLFGCRLSYAKPQQNKSAIGNSDVVAFLLNRSMFNGQ